MRLVHREILWSLAATAGVTAALAGWALDHGHNNLSQLLTAGGFAVGLAGTACAHTLYGRRTAPTVDRATFEQSMLNEVQSVLLTEAIVWRAHGVDNGVDRAAHYETAAAFLRYMYDPQNAPYYDRELPG